MPSTYTTSLRLEKIADGEQNQTWGQTVNRQFDLIDAAIAGATYLNVSGQTSITVTSATGLADQARNAALVLTGNLGADCRIIYPAANKALLVFNNVTGTGAVLLAHSANGPVIRLTAGVGGLFFGDGTQFTALGGGVLLLAGLNVVNGATVGGNFSVGGTTYLTTANISASAAVTNNLSVGGIAYVNGAPVTINSAFGYTRNGATGLATGPIACSILATNAVVAMNFFATSDARLKSDLSALTPDEGRAWVQAVQPMRYTMDGRASAGFVAQDVARVGYDDLVQATPLDGLPEHVAADGFTSPAGAKLTLDYLQMIAYLTAHAQSLEARLAALEAADAD